MKLQSFKQQKQIPLNGEISFDDNFDSKAIHVVFLVQLITRAVPVKANMKLNDHDNKQPCYV